MTLGGWIFMSASVTFVVALAAFCCYHVLKGEPDRDTSRDDDAPGPA